MKPALVLFDMEAHQTDVVFTLLREEQATSITASFLVSPRYGSGAATRCQEITKQELIELIKKHLGNKQLEKQPLLGVKLPGK